MPSVVGPRRLDLRAMAEVVIENVAYGTAVISGASNAEGQREQDVCFRGLAYTSSVTRISHGTYFTRVATAPLARKRPNGKPFLVELDWPIIIQGGVGQNVPGATFMASAARSEEKSSDVNVASHLLIDVLTGVVDAAVIVSRPKGTGG